MTKTIVLVIDDNEHQHELLRVYAMRVNDIELTHANTIEEAIQMVETHAPQIIFLDNRLHPFDDFRETVPKLRAVSADSKIVIISSEISDPFFSEASSFSVTKVIDKAHISLSSFPNIIQELR